MCASDYVGQAPALIRIASPFFRLKLIFDDFQLSIPSSAFSESINST
jgi:hypothetical protein